VVCPPNACPELLAQVADQLPAAHCEAGGRTGPRHRAGEVGVSQRTGVVEVERVPGPGAQVPACPPGAVTYIGPGVSAEAAESEGYLGRAKLDVVTPAALGVERVWEAVASGLGGDAVSARA
jgi:hypothetical protein